MEAPLFRCAVKVMSWFWHSWHVLLECASSLRAVSRSTACVCIETGDGRDHCSDLHRLRGGGRPKFSEWPRFVHLGCKV